MGRQNRTGVDWNDKEQVNAHRRKLWAENHEYRERKKAIGRKSYAKRMSNPDIKARERERLRKLRQDPEKRAKYNAQTREIKRRKREDHGYKEKEKAQQREYMKNRRMHDSEYVEYNKKYLRSYTAEQYYKRAAPFIHKQHGRCGACGRDMDPRDFHKDHIIPLSQGGSDDDNNIWYICIKCNSRKNKKSLQQFLSLIDEYDDIDSAMIDKYDLRKYLN